MHPYFRVSFARLAKVAVIGSLAGFAAPCALAGDPPPYEDHIRCETADNAKTCKIDLWLTRGYRAFSQCQVCHGLDGNGSTIGPSLIDKLREVDRARFMESSPTATRGRSGSCPPGRRTPTS